jgi:hypothetical protein
MNDNMNDDVNALLPPVSTTALIQQTVNLLAGCVAAILLLSIVTYMTTPL